MRHLINFREGSKKMKIIKQFKCNNFSTGRYEARALIHQSTLHNEQIRELIGITFPPVPLDFYISLLPNQLLLSRALNIISVKYIWCNYEVAGYIPGSSPCRKLRETYIFLERLINNLHLVALYLLELQHPAALRREFILCRLLGGRPGCDELTWKSSPWCTSWRIVQSLRSGCFKENVRKQESVQLFPI